MASVSVKVPTDKVIALIQEKLAEIDAKIESYPADVEKYENDLKKHKAKIISLTIDALSNKTHLIGEDYNSAIRVNSNNGNGVSISVNGDALGFPNTPEKPENPNERVWIGRDYTSKREILANTLRTLQLTEQETINASTYSNVMKFL